MLIGFLRFLGFAIAWDKVISPTQKVVYLGIEIDSGSMELPLPKKKLTKINDLVDNFKERSQATRKDLQVLAGYLAHASAVVCGGKTFSRRLIHLIKYFRDSLRRVHLPEWFYADVNWWSKLMTSFNGAAKIITDIPLAAHSVLTASSMSGFSGLCGQDWFVGVWGDHKNVDGVIPEHHMSPSPSEYSDSMNINILGLWPILVAANRWGHSWSNYKIRIFTDNTQVLHMVNSGRTSSVPCMFWIKELFWLSYIYNFHLVAFFFFFFFLFVHRSNSALRRRSSIEILLDI